MASWLVVRSLLRQRWRSLAGLALVLALLGGLGLGALAGARRTQSSYPRFERWDRTSTLAVDPGDRLDILKRAEQLPQVVAHQRYAALDVAPLDGAGRPQLKYDFEALASMDGRYFDIDRFAATEGRLPDPGRVDEMAVNRFTADGYDLHVGQVLRLGVFDDDDVRSEPDPTKIRPKVVQRTRIVGIGLFPEEVVQDEADSSPLVLLTPAFERKADRWATYYWSGLILRNGDADVEGYQDAYRKLLPPGFPEFFRVTSGITYHAQQAIRPLSIALALFGVAAFAAGLVLTVLGIGREVGAVASERRTLRSVGFDRRQLILATAAGPMVASVAGAVGAVVAAVALSPTMPLGPVRAVEVDKGVSIDATVLLLGPLVLLMVLGLAAFGFAARAGSADRRARVTAERPSWFAALAARLGLGVATVLGLRLAFDPGAGRGRTSVRSVIAACSVAIACLAAALTFSASLDTLVHRPALYGWDWDVAVIDGAGYFNMDPKLVDQVLGADPDVESWGGFNFGSGTVEGVSVAMIGAQPQADVTPPVTEGRAPRRADEVALGAATAARLGRSVGDRVRVRTSTGARTLRVVGIAVLPTVGIVHGDHTSLGTGIWLAASQIPGIARQVGAETVAGPNSVFIRFRDGVDVAAATRRLRKQMPDLDPVSYAAQLFGVQRPGEIVNTSDLGSAPALLAAVLIGASTVALGLMLTGSVRRQRRDLAVFRTLGGTSRQLRGTVLWQSAATVAAGTVIGVPVGVAAGRLAWARFATQLEVVPHPTVPGLAIGELVLAAAVVAYLVAVGPGVAAARTPVAAALRAE